MIPSPTDTPGGEQSITVPVVAGDDDAEEQNGRVNTSSGDLEMAENQNRPQIVDIRFQNVAIPAGATIANVYIQFVADSNQGGSANLEIAGQSGNAAAFNNGNKVSSRPLTSGRTNWSNVPNWQSGQTYQTPDLMSVVQEIVNGSGWTEGSAMAFVISDSGKRAATSYNSSPGKAPVLVVEFVVNGASAALTEGTNPSNADSLPYETYLSVVKN